MLDPSRPEARALALPTVLLVGAAWLFFGVLEDVVNGDPLLLADSAIYRALQDLRTTPGDAVMIAITELGDTKVVVAVTIAVLLSCCGSCGNAPGVPRRRRRNGCSNICFNKNKQIVPYGL
ncbi:hypothetical protein ACK3BE_32535 (plasmid) [Pseudomonas mandelii]|uniref:hypothetical protein n=1 Tax=Pseudomonas mandelii TaxID=75612 RepID=UPI001428C9F7|nr:hypothetical protein [Pseudomonas mandelii]